MTGGFPQGSLMNTICSHKLVLTSFFINLYMSSKGRMYERTGEGLAKQRKKSAIPLVQSMYHTVYVSLKLCMIL